MLRILKDVCVAVGCLGFAGVMGVANAQEVIHAMTGTIRSIDTGQKSFTLFNDSGWLITFKDMTGAKTQNTDRVKLFSNAAAARAFDKKDAYVIVFYYGIGEDLTAVAVRALGTGPFTAAVGTIISFNEKSRTISVKDESGSIHSYKINAETVAESDSGVVEGFKIRAGKGGHIRVVGAVTGDSLTALFLSPM
jgi:hypothetical protein